MPKFKFDQHVECFQDTVLSIGTLYQSMCEFIFSTPEKFLDAIKSFDTPLDR